MTLSNPQTPDNLNLPLEQQVVRLQALLEASRLVHSTIHLDRVLETAARIAVLELELQGAAFTNPFISYGDVPEEQDVAGWQGCARFPLSLRDGSVASELLVMVADDRSLSLYEIDFLEGLVLQTAIAVENAAHHQRHLEYARVTQDLAAARAIQQSLLPQNMPVIRGYSLAARSEACYQVGGDYLDIVLEPDGSYLVVVADVAGKGLASALVCMAFRSAFRAFARLSLQLRELAARLSQQHWEEGEEAQRRYVTAIFLRLDASGGDLEFVNAGHNPAFLLLPGFLEPRLIAASGPPIGLLAGSRYTTERSPFPPASRLLLYTDGLTETFQGEEEFGIDRLAETFSSARPPSAAAMLDTLWKTLNNFTGHAAQGDDMTAFALSRDPGTSEERT